MSTFNFDSEYLEISGCEVGSEPCSHKNGKHDSNGNLICIDCGDIIDNCPHNDCISTGNASLCTKCGAEIFTIDFSPETTYDFKSKGKNLPRCRKSKSTRKTLKLDFDSLGVRIDKAIREITTTKYLAITQGETTRGKTRKGLVAACLFYAYIEENKTRSREHICEIFRIDQTKMKEGLEKYHSVFPEEAKFIHPEDILESVMNFTGVDMEYYESIRLLTSKLSKSSSELQRSQPQSVAAAMVWFCISRIPNYISSKGLTKASFASKADLSEITITKLTNIISDVLSKSK